MYGNKKLKVIFDNIEPQDSVINTLDSPNK